MHHRIFSAFPLRVTSRRRDKRTFPFWMPIFVAFVISTLLINTYGNVTLAYATAASDPNPTIESPDWLTSPQTVSPPDLGTYVTGQPDPTQQHISSPQDTQTPEIFSLTPDAQHIMTQDQHLEVDVPAGAISAQQVADAGGQIQLSIVQTDAGSGSSLSGQLMLGTYQLSFMDTLGNPLTTLVLAQPFTVSYHLSSDQSSLLWQDQTVYALWNNVTPTATTSSSAKALVPQIQTAASDDPIYLTATKDASSLRWSTTTHLSASAPGLQASAKTATSQAVIASATAAAASSTISFSTQAPQASWGTP